jgi:anti-sigma factor RsiW
MKHHHDLECKDLAQHLSAYIDDELDDELCGKIEAHIESCPKCKIVVNTLRKTIQLYQDDGESETYPLTARHRLFAELGLDEEDGDSSK